MVSLQAFATNKTSGKYIHQLVTQMNSCALATFQHSLVMRLHSFKADAIM